MKYKFHALLLLVALLCSLGASCKGSNQVPPPIPPATDMKIYEAFYQTEAKYNAIYDLVVEFSKLTAKSTNLGCSAGIKQVCDAGKEYKKFYDAKLVPASQKATDAYNGALDVYQDYRKGSASEATLQEKLDYLRKMIDDLDSLFNAGKEKVQ